jgi:hypothetical protein
VQLALPVSLDRVALKVAVLLLVIGEVPVVVREARNWGEPEAAAAVRWQHRYHRCD